MSLVYQIKNFYDSPYADIDYVEMILESFDTIFPPDGVDNLNKTLNGSKEKFSSEEGKKFRTHLLTRLSSFFGFPNRKLRKNSGQSIQNLVDNIIGKQENASDTRNLIRATTIPLNILMVPLKLLLNILKIITEFIPSCLFQFCNFTLMKLLRNARYNRNFLKKFFIITVGTVLYALSNLLLYFYFAGCCLTSPFDTMKSAWHVGVDLSEHFNLNYKQLAYVFVAICILATVGMNLWALPIALKIFATTAAPWFTHRLPTAVMNIIDKIGTAIKPTLTAIGHALTDISAYMPTIFQMYYTIPLVKMFSSMPSFIGASLFIATAIATIGPSISGYINDFKEWWNFNPDFVKPLENEGNNSEELNQQCKMLCALREPEET